MFLAANRYPLRRNMRWRPRAGSGPALAAALAAPALLLHCPRRGNFMQQREPASNVDVATVQGFGREWQTFTQDSGALSDADRAAIFHCYFDLFPWHLVDRESVGADIGCGS